MHTRNRLFLALFALVAAFCVGQAQAQEDPVVVNNVKFYSNEGAYKDNLVEVELRAIKNPNPEAPNARYVDNVKVILTIGYPNPDRKKENDYIFYESSVTIATLEVGQNRKIGFWLPYDIVQRDNVSKEPKYWLVTMEVDGTTIPDSQTNVGKRACSSLQNPAALNGFKNASSGGVSKTEGIMLPGYLSGNGYREAREKRPPFIRKEEN